ncbi:MAG: hypothetical protein ACRDKS_18060 [Actinomycetota bacterium]
MTTRSRGRYGFQPVGGFIAPEPANHWEPVHGLPMAMQYAYGSLRAADGTYWWPIRGAYTEKARFLHLPESTPGTDFVFQPEGDKAYTGPVTHEQRDGVWGVWLPDGSPLLSTDGPTFTWNEGDALNVRGELFGDALQFFVPDADEPLVYTSRLFRGTGTIKGSPVTGLFFHDSMHMPAGMNFITSSYLTALEAAWVAFATEFEDGTIHTGHLVWGTDNYKLMIIQRSDGPPIVAHDLDVEVTFDGLEPPFPSKVRYTGEGETWIWEAHASGGRCPVRTDLPEGHRWIQGWVYRQGEMRKPVCTEALMETYNGRLADVTVGS